VPPEHELGPRDGGYNKEGTNGNTLTQALLTEDAILASGRATSLLKVKININLFRRLCNTGSNCISL
jgi:hypothetical protein